MKLQVSKAALDSTKAMLKSKKFNADVETISSQEYAASTRKLKKHHKENSIEDVAVILEEDGDYMTFNFGSYDEEKLCAFVADFMEMLAALKDGSFDWRATRNLSADSNR